MSKGERRIHTRIVIGGIVLLVAGARYARLVAAQGAGADAATGPQPVVPGPGPRSGPPPR